MRLLVVTTISGLLVAGCIGRLTEPAMSLPGETLAGSALQSDTWNHIVMLDDALEASDCSVREVVDTQVIAYPSGAFVRGGALLDGGWIEEWTLDRCGEPVVYRVDYIADGRGGTMIRPNLVSDDY
jgi:hypothetical protein